MAEVTLAFPDHDQIRTLFGPRDEHLRQVREFLGIGVVLRGDELKLTGDEDHVQQGLRVFEELRGLVQKQGQLSDDDVGRVLSSFGQNGGSPGEISDATAHVKVRPRSEGQVDYVRKVEQNDLVFCVGPAGCGKTYLAVAMAVSA